MIAGILKEPTGEHRVAFMPEQVEVLVKKGITVYIESSIGNSAYADDESYTTKGAEIQSRYEILSKANILFTIQPLSAIDIELLKGNVVLIGIYQPFSNIQLIK